MSENEVNVSENEARAKMIDAAIEQLKAIKDSDEPFLAATLVKVDGEHSMRLIHDNVSSTEIGGLAARVLFPIYLPLVEADGLEKGGIGVQSYFDNIVANNLMAILETAEPELWTKVFAEYNESQAANTPQAD